MHEAKHGLVSHVTEILNLAILLRRELGLEIIRIEPLNDLRTMFLKPGTTFLMRKFELGIVVLLSKPESTIVDYVDRLP